MHQNLPCFLASRLSFIWKKLALVLLLTSITGITHAQLSVSFSVQEPACFGIPNGSVTAVATGGTAPYSYVWNTGVTGATLSSIPAGSYSVTVTDAASQQVTGNVTVNNPPLLDISFVADTCTLPFDATAVASGGAGPYTFQWATGQSGATITINGLGVYCVTVTDANLCSAVDCLKLFTPPLNVTVNTGTVTCPGGSDGSLTATAIEGTPPYSYLWSNGQTTSTITGLSPGVFTVTVTDAGGCSDSATGVVNDPPPFVVSVNSVNPVCPGDNDGSAAASVSGGTPPFTYAWSNGQSGPVISNLAPGTYTVTVTDVNGCIAAKTITIANVSNLIVGGLGTPETCPDANNGFATVTSQNGVLPYTYLWNTGQTTQVLVGMAPGTYSVTVTDAVGCTGSTNVVVAAAPDFTVEVNGTDVTTCGAADGTATAVVTAGVPPYLYEWNTGATTPAITGLAPGTYSVTVTNFNSCEATGSVTIAEPPPVSVSITGDTQVCEGESNASLSVVISGGTPPFDINWNTGDITQTVDGLSAGSYTVIVTDANGCQDNASATITEIDAPVAVITATEIVCGAGNTGTATAAATGGLPPYTFAWSTGAGTATIANLPEGTYTVTVTDANQCTGIADVTITVIDDLAITTLTQDVDCFGNSTGRATASATGGTMPYTFAWSNGGTTANIVDQPAGTYTVTVTDANGCTATTTAVINQPMQLTVTLINMDPEICPEEATGTLTAMPAGGTPPYSFAWSNGETTQMITNLAAGTYTVTVTDANDCTATATATINESPPLQIDLTATEIVCAPESTGEASVSVSGGQPPYAIAWSTGESTENIDGLPTGTYSVTVTDANQCSATAEVTITVIDDFVVNVIPRDPFCHGENSGGILVLVTGGTMPYSFTWSTGDTGTDELTGLAAGTYSVTVEDANGCMLSEEVVLVEPPLLEMSASGTDPLCFGSNDGSATAAASGGTPPYSYFWSNGQLLETAVNLAAGTYTVTVMDANDCELTTTVTLNNPPELTVNVNAPLIQCAGATGALTALPAGGTPPYSFLWSTGATTAAVAGLPAGTYQLTVTDDNDCTVIEQSVILDEVPQLSITFNVTDIICSDDNIGAIAAAVTGGTPPYSFAWSSGQTTPDIADLAPGDYTLTVTDANDCIVMATATVNQTPGLLVSIDATDITCFGDDNGVATAVVNGGTPPYTFAWSNLGTSATISGLTPGAYSVTVTDTEGCAGEAAVTIAEPSELDFSLSSTPVTCAGDADGSATVIATGGTPPYTYAWNTGATSATAAGLGVGVYSVTVTDSNDCEVSGNIAVDGPDAITLTADVLSGTCVDAMTGSIRAEAAGGTGPYVYSWSNGDSGPVISGLPPGTYTVTVIDINGCTASQTVMLTAFPNPVCSVTTSSPVVTGGDGELTCSVSGGTPPFTFAWDNGQTSQTAVNLDPGTYTVTVTDANGCTTSCQGTLDAPARVGDFVWLDLDRDGLQDPGEPGIPNVTVIITEVDEFDPPYADTTVTDGNGIYGFDVPPGTFKITFILPPGVTLEPTTPNVGTDDSIDSDPDPVMLMTDIFTIELGDVNLTFDAGFTTICENITDAGVVGPDYQFLCGPGNDPDPIVNLETPSGGSGAIEYLWMYSVIGGPFNDLFWYPIPGATSADYDPGPLYETTYFIRCARRENCTAYLESNMVVVEVGSVAVADIQGPMVVCEDETVTFFAGGTGPGAVIEWDLGPAATPATATGSQVDVVFGSFGSFDITLTVTENGCTSTQIKRITVTNNPTTCGGGMILNLSLNEEEAVVVDWSVAQSGSILYNFTVEHSEDGERFSEVGTVTEAWHTEDGVKYFQFIHSEPKRGLNFYRVKATDQLNRTGYSEIGEIILYNDSKLMMIYPNPVTDELTLELFETFNNEVLLEFFTADGRQLRQLPVSADSRRVNLDFSPYPPGVYFLRVKYSDQDIKVLKVVKK